MSKLFEENEIRNQLSDLGKEDIAKKLDVHFNWLNSNAQPDIHLDDQQKISEPRRARNNLMIFKQGLVHRCGRLIEAAASMVRGHNCHGMALIVRGHLESTAQLGYFCDRLHSLGNGNITFDAFHLKLAETLMGAGHKVFEKAPKPLHILTCIEKADIHLTRLFHNPEFPKDMLMDSYNWLSDFCHPNFLSNASAFVLDSSTNTIHFRHSDKFSKKDSELLLYLAASTEIFKVFFEDLSDVENNLPAG